MKHNLFVVNLICLLKIKNILVHIRPLIYYIKTKCFWRWNFLNKKYYMVIRAQRYEFSFPPIKPLLCLWKLLWPIMKEFSSDHLFKKIFKLSTSARSPPRMLKVASMDWRFLTRDERAKKSARASAAIQSLAASLCNGRFIQLYPNF